MIEASLFLQTLKKLLNGKLAPGLYRCQLLTFLNPIYPAYRAFDIVIILLRRKGRYKLTP
ncbi:hypothetical protein YDYSY3_44410 [Paenibacillus chitinolyticus]|nr:hypothetical protein YDYSY3_44410 [Paenibacillus chitinolyticus]